MPLPLRLFGNQSISSVPAGAKRQAGKDYPRRERSEASREPGTSRSPIPLPAPRGRRPRSALPSAGTRPVPPARTGAPAFPASSAANARSRAVIGGIPFSGSGAMTHYHLPILKNIN